MNVMAVVDFILKSFVHSKDKKFYNCGKDGYKNGLIRSNTYSKIVVNELDCKIVLSEFEIQSCYNVHYSFATRMALALDNPRRLIYH